MRIAKQSKNSFIVLLLAGSILFSCGVDQGNDLIREFQETHERELKSYYFYPSTIRTLAKLMGGDYETSLVGLKECKVFLCWDSQEKELSEAFRDLEKNILEQGYENLGVMRSSGNRVSMNINDLAAVPVYVILIENSEGNHLLELKGEIPYQTLTKLASMDFSSVSSMIDLGKPDKETAEEIQEKSEREEEQ